MFFHKKAALKRHCETFNLEKINRHTRCKQVMIELEKNEFYHKSNRITLLDTSL